MAARDSRQSRETYKTKCAVSDLLGLSTAIALVMDGIERRLCEEELEETLSEEQEERLQELFLTLHRAAEDVADFAREVAEQMNPEGS